jgi:protein TonB
MDQLMRNMTGFLLGVFSATIITLVLYIALPLLTQFQPSLSRKTGVQSVMISSRKPPPPPSEDRDRLEEQKLVEKKQTRKQTKQARRSQPQFVIPRVTFGMGTGNIGSIEIGVVQDFSISDSLFMSAFQMTEVDQPPRVLRVFPPQYPYVAKRDNIEGRVVLRFVVDVDGLAKESKIVVAQPEGVFEEAAFKALERYKFRPAIKNGKPVTCIVNLPITFRLL